MGRGRSKAKETKVARDLKYSNPDMDLERLAKELHGELDGKKVLKMMTLTQTMITQSLSKQ
jgi:hypothetical protein